MRYNQDQGENKNQQVPVYRKVKKDEGVKEPQLQTQKSIPSATSGKSGSILDLKKNKSNASNTTNRFGGMAEDDSD